MARDEPFKKGAKLHVDLSKDQTKDVFKTFDTMTSFHGLLAEHPKILTSESPEYSALVVDPDWDLVRKLRYLRTRRASALQMHAAKRALMLDWPLSGFINLQRLLECHEFLPARSWCYYPVVDKTIGTGVPRAQPELPMLAYPEVVVTLPANITAIFSTDDASLFELKLEH